MFANDLLQHYADNLQRQGNAPAEANHSSVLQRLGSEFYESPLRLIQALMKRHNDLTAERHHIITKYYLEASSEAWKSPDENEKKALLSLGMWGMALFRLAIEDSVRLEMTELPDGKRAFSSEDNSEHIHVILDPCSTVCMLEEKNSKKNSSGEAQLTKSRQKYSHTDDNNDDDETTSSVFLVN
jgi:hypothetical protein